MNPGIENLQNLHVISEMNQIVNGSLSKQPKFNCPMMKCTKIFKSKKAAKDHIRIHNGDRPYVCSEKECHKSFAQYSSLQKHERIHNGQRPYLCKICGSSFSQISNLKRHERLHTGEKPHVCKDCNKKFTTASNLKQHCLTHQTERSKYICKYCDKCYFYKSSLKKHLKEHPKIAIKKTGRTTSNLDDDSLTTRTNSIEICLGFPNHYESPNNFLIKKEFKVKRLNEKVFDITLPKDELSIFQTSNTIKPEKLIVNLKNSQENKKSEPIQNLNNPVQNKIADEAIHAHFHSEHCEHLQIVHQNHVDYLHNGMLCHYKTDGTISIHELEANEKNPMKCRPLTSPAHNFPFFLDQYHYLFDPFFSKNPQFTNIQGALNDINEFCKPAQRLCKWNEIINKKKVMNLANEDNLVDLEADENFSESKIKTEDCNKSKHLHGDKCGHNKIIHSGHYDFIVDGKLHHIHGDHCDDHGEISFPSIKKRKLSHEFI